jgi:biofilm PGA synthesis N-glycosyltransferase PgaC
MSAEILFWASAIFVFYVYGGYPLLLACAQRVAGRRVAKAYWEPSVSVIIAVHNERGTIERKLRNCLQLDYPKDRLQIIVSLDGSTDGTDEIADSYAWHGVEVVRSVRHRGKAAAVNRAVLAATGEILFFTDARQRLDTRAVRELVANFSDATVGAATGELILQDADTRESSDGVGLYWRYEKKLRAMESRIHSTVGATGAIYAVRRRLYKPIPADTILDDIAVPMRLVLAGWRSVFDPAARAYDHVSESLDLEYGRKVRTLAGNYQLLCRMPELVLPWRNPVWFQYVSHKLGRLVAPYFLAALLVSNLFLARGLYLVPFICQTVWYGAAVLGAFAVRRAAAAPMAGELIRGGKRT